MTRKELMISQKVIIFFGLKDRQLIIFIPLVIIRYWLYAQFFLVWFSYKMSFVPTFLLGLTTALLMIKHTKEE